MGKRRGARKRPRIHIARSPTPLADGKIYHYAYLRYEVWDPKKNRYQPKNLASLGRVDRLEEGRLDTLGGFLQEWLKKDSSLPFEALKERFRAAEPMFAHSAVAGLRAPVDLGAGLGRARIQGCGGQAG